MATHKMTKMTRLTFSKLAIPPRTGRHVSATRAKVTSRSLAYDMRMNLFDLTMDHDPKWRVEVSWDGAWTGPDFGTLDRLRDEQRIVEVGLPLPTTLTIPPGATSGEFERDVVPGSVTVTTADLRLLPDTAWNVVGRTFTCMGQAGGLTVNALPVIRARLESYDETLTDEWERGIGVRMTWLEC